MQRAWFYLIFPLLFASWTTTLLFAQTNTPAVLPKIWNGEIIEADQGLVSLSAVIIDAKMQPRGGEFSFLMKGRKNKIVYNFAAKTQNPKEIPAQYWRIREDTYDLLELSVGDEKGVARKWKGPYPKPLIVSPKNLSLLGAWYVLTPKDEPVKVLLKPLRHILPLERWKGSVQSVTDAFTGQILQHYQKQAPPQQAEVRRVLRGVRSIQMLYKLDLFRLNAFAGDMVKVLNANDADIRSCYTDLLDKESSAQGNLIYSFVYSGIEQGIKSLKIKQSSLRDAEFQECLYFKLRGLTFPLQKSLAGELSFQFNIVERKE